MTEAYDIIHYQSGTHFDPQVVSAFETIKPEVRELIERLKTSSSD